jgi:hypothetical protein
MDQSGKILINFDECLGEDEMESGDKSNQWKYLYDADYKLLFNEKIFPEELLQGKNVGDYFIVRYGLFDAQVKAENINIGSVSNPNDSHMI